MLANCLVAEVIQPPRACVGLDLLVPKVGAVFVQPAGELRKLFGGELFNRCLNLGESGHGEPPRFILTTRETLPQRLD